MNSLPLKTNNVSQSLEQLKLLQKHYMIIGKRCNSITSVYNETVKDSLARFISSMIEPDITKVMETRKLVAYMPDEWFKNVISKSLKFI